MPATEVVDLKQQAARLAEAVREAGALALSMFKTPLKNWTKGEALSPVSDADIAADVSGVYPQILQQGQMDAGVWSCGMVAGLIHDVPTVRELIDRIMADADRIIRERLLGALIA